jgi:hypothetical protein
MTAFRCHFTTSASQVPIASAYCDNAEWFVYGRRLGETTTGDTNHIKADDFIDRSSLSLTKGTSGKQAGSWTA